MARDLIHNLVKTALQNAGWKITHDPYPLKVGGSDMEVDLGAETLMAAEKDTERIAVEIKTFAGLSKVYDFHLAVGQFVDYKIALHSKDPDRQLFVAITADVYEDLFQIPFAKLVVETIGMKLIVVDKDGKDIKAWIS